MSAFFVSVWTSETVVGEHGDADAGRSVALVATQYAGIG